VPKPLKVGLKANQSKTTSLGIVVPADVPPGSYTLTAVLDATALNDTNPDNNTLTAGSPVQIG
jgi:ABC-type molybdate transport system substrate-binding protein